MIMNLITAKTEKQQKSTLKQYEKLMDKYEDKKPFLLLAEQDKKRYEKEMGEQEKLGYFID